MVEPGGPLSGVKAIELAHIVVMQRPEEHLNMPDELAQWYHAHQAQQGDELLAAGKIWSIPVTQLAISATAIREALYENRDVRYLLPDAVITLIEQMGMYQIRPQAS